MVDGVLIGQSLHDFIEEFGVLLHRLGLLKHCDLHVSYLEVLVLELFDVVRDCDLLGDVSHILLVPLPNNFLDAVNRYSSEKHGPDLFVFDLIKLFLLFLLRELLLIEPGAFVDLNLIHLDLKILGLGLHHVLGLKHAFLLLKVWLVNVIHDLHVLGVARFHL